MLRTASCNVLVWFVAATTWAAGPSQEQLGNWHQWRGPEANGTAPNGDPPLKWDEQTNVRWKVSLPGKGHATPIIWGDRIFLLTAIKTDRQTEKPVTEASVPAPVEPKVRLVAFTESNAAASPAAEPAPAAAPADPAKPVDAGAANPPAAGGPPGGGGGRGGRGRGPAPPPTNYYQFVALCVDRKTGDALWQQTACEVVPHEGTHDTGSFASASPITDGKRVYCSFGSRGLYCYDMNGKPLWRVDLGRMKMALSFGEGSSPALYGDTLVVNCDQQDDKSYIMALDARTGDEKWRKPRDENTTWATPLVVERGGRTQVVVNGKNRSRGYDLATGEVLWECGGQVANPIPSPVAIDNLAFCVTGFRGYSLYAIPLDSTGDITDTDNIAWHRNEGTPYVSSPVAYNGRLFFTKDRTGIMSCLDAASGEVIIDQKRLPGLEDIYASPVAAAGRVYFTARNGKTVVIDAASDELNVLSENQVDDTINASPAIAGKEIFLRGEKSLYCIAE